LPISGKLVTESILCPNILSYNIKALMFIISLLLFLGLISQPVNAQPGADMHLEKWILPDKPPYPENNQPTSDRVELGKMLFFDPRLSSTGNMSCASCHNPKLGWSDGEATAIGKNGKVLGRASPTIVNTAYNNIFMWDGRKASLIDQATGPLDSPDEMDKNTDEIAAELHNIAGYRTAFTKAYPGEAISRDTIARAIAAFENTIVCNDSPFDRYIRGDISALSPQQVDGLALFIDPDKGNCSTCHQAPNFTDNGFHNVGLTSFGNKDHDVGRHKIKPIRIMDGAFKTPPLRGIASTGPYFHDGSVATLDKVVDYYVEGGSVKTNLSPDLQKLDLSGSERKALVSFLKALSCETKDFVEPQLPM
jgi:cytochrome c peroxidase